MIALSPDEHRIVIFLQKLAERYEQQAPHNPFTYPVNMVRAKLCRRLAAAINEGRHR